MRDDKFRFKYWDGAKTYWTYHLEDLFKSLIDGRDDFIQLSNKYAPVTDFLFNFKNIHSDQIYRLTYRYYPSDEVDVLYEVKFAEALKEQHLEDSLLKEMYEGINDLNIIDLRIDIDYGFQKECSPCQKAKQERENAQSN